MPTYSYAIISAFLWALSAPILNKGITSLPKNDRIPFLLFGLFIAMLTGTLLLYFLTDQRITAFHANIYVLMAGIFTFPVATGLYYISAYAFGGRTELASQFAKIKPIFSILLALIILDETVGFWSWLAVATILFGLIVFSLGAVYGRFSWVALAIGLMTSLSWAIGEVFVKLGFKSGATLPNTFIALAFSTLIFAIVLLPIMFRMKIKEANLMWILPFMLHGVLSFGFAYTSFFKSITLIGVAKTALINAFWPFLAILLSSAINRFEGKEYRNPIYVWIAAAMLMTGSIIQVVNL